MGSKRMNMEEQGYIKSWLERRGSVDAAYEEKSTG